MLSTGEQAGNEATIIRADGTKLNECDVKNSVNKKGAAVTECWIECEKDAVLALKLERNGEELEKFGAIKCFNDLTCRSTAFGTTMKPAFFRNSCTRDPVGKVMKQSLFRCSGVNIVVVEEGAIVEPGTLHKIGRTRITFTPLEWVPCDSKDEATVDGPGRKAYFRSAVIMEEVIDDGSESTITNKSMPKVANAKQKQNPDWQTFIFNYRQKAPLETMDVIAPTLSPQDIATKRPRDDASDKAQNKKLVIRPVAGPSTTAAAVISSNESIVQDADKEWEDLKAERIKALQNARNSTQAGMDGLLKIGYKLNDATEERWMAGKADRIKLLQDKIDTIQTEIDFLSGNTAKGKGKKGKISATAKADQSVDLSMDAD